MPERVSVPLADTWDLTPLFPTPEAWSASFTELLSSFEAIERFRGRVGASAEALRDTMEFDKELSLKIERLAHYASLRCAEDGSDDDHLAREGQLHNLLTRIGAASAFIAPEIQSIPDDVFAAFLQDPALAEWIIPLRKMRRMKPHTLTSGEERLLALAHSSLAGHEETFGQLTNVDMQFGSLADEKGIEKPLSQSSYSSFLQQRNPQVRCAAFRQFYKEFADHRYTIASSLAHSVKTDVFLARARNHPSALEAALFRDDVPTTVYDNLITSVRSHLPALYRYYELRREVLSLPEIHQYDTYVPIVPNFDRKTSFDEAIEMVIASLSPLGSEYCATLADGLRKNRWCDRYENKAKRSGAFSSSSYRNPPFMMMNYKHDVFSDVYTLAHEAGHSMHTWYSQATQPFQTYDYPIFLAEVASTFNEELLTHHLLETNEDPRFRAFIINRQIDDIRGTIYRQTMFAEFEKLIHAMEESGEALTLDSFRETYRGLLDAYFGPDFAIDEELELECLRIPHFYHAFYVYKYATGLSAALALSQQVLATGDATAYLGFLRSGGSEFPIPTLKRAGVDMMSPEPVRAALTLFEDRVKELERLLSEL